MKALKRIIALILVSIFVIGAVFISYTGMKNGAVVYAAVNDDSIYVPLRSESDAVKVFQAYCKSRDLTIEGSLTDAVTTFTTGAFNSACNELGIDITELQAEIKAEYDESGEPVKFFLNDTGVMAMNRIFAQFLQDNELQVGDEDVNDTVFDGQYYDDDTNGALIYIIDSSVSENVDVFEYSGKILQYGSQFMYTNQYIYDSGSTSIAMPFKNSAGTYNLRIGRYTNVNTNMKFMSMNFYNTSPSQYSGIVTPTSTSTPPVFNGSLIIYKRDNGTTFHLASIFTHNNGTGRILNLGPITFTQQQTPQNTNIVIVSNTINNNNYEGDTYITNEGDVINNNPDNPDEPDFPDYPSEPTGNPDDWGAEMPDLNIPWYLQGKEDKFPWNIPFNIMLTLSLLKAEPQAPHFEGTMDFKFTTYNYEIDLSEFDDVAEVLRKMEVIAFLIGLMVLTRNLIGW